MAQKVSRIYSNFRGVDFRGEEINLFRSPDSMNMWKDYRYTESISTRPGLALAGSNALFDNAVYGIFFFRDNLLIHSGDKLYLVRRDMSSPSTVLYSGLNAMPSSGFIYNDAWYFLDGRHYLKFDGEDIGEVIGFVPTTTIARKPGGGGQKHQDVNFLSDHRINSFLADGVSRGFYLDTKGIDDDYIPVVTVNDKVVPQGDYTVNYAEGKVIFNDNVEPPSKPLTDGQDNVVIEFKKTVPNYRENIEKCTIVQVFDNRVFFSGNPERPNMVWSSALYDPSYCSDLDYYEEGMDDSAVRGLVAGNNALWVFREPSDANTTIFYHTPATDDNEGRIFPSSHSSVTIGCIGRAINFNDDIVFFSERGMEGINGDVTTEQVVAHRSSLVDRKMVAEELYRDMILVEWEGYLLVIIGSRVYLADSRAMFTNGTHIEYDWFTWQFDQRIYCATVNNGILYLGTENGVYELTDYDANVDSYWVTPLDKFEFPNRLKTTNKRGCVTEGKGDVSLYAKLEDTDFELIGNYEDVTDYFVSRIKRKKFKDIQLKFHSDTRFWLETVTLECFIGGYIKR